MRWVIRFLFKALIGFLGLSLALVLVFKFIPVPVTATMLMDSNGITKDWTALSNIDRTMVRSTMKAENLVPST